MNDLTFTISIVEGTDLEGGCKGGGGDPGGQDPPLWEITKLHKKDKRCVVRTNEQRFRT